MGLQVIEQLVHGRRRKLLVQDHIPVYYPNLYITMEHSRKALDTTKKYLEHLIMLEEFLAFSSIDLISRLEQRPDSQYLTDPELSRFVSDAGYSKETLTMKYAGVRLHPTAYVPVGSIHAQQRIEAVRDYLAYLYDKLGDHSKRTEIDDLKKRINRKIKAARPAWKKTRLDDMKGLTSQERARLREIMHPDSPENPFSDEAIRWRNWIILLLGLDMGLRRSEMLLIKTSDIHWHSHQLAVVNLEDESFDPRTMAPQFKTNERMLQMPEDDLYHAIQKYESIYRRRKNRSGASQALRHPFLLVAHKRNEGGPLTIKGMDGVLSRVRKIAPELANVSLHTLRHDAVYTILDSMHKELAALGPEDRTTQVEKTLTYMFGWSRGSNMPGLYGAKFWKEEADKAIQNRAEQFKANRQKAELTQGGSE